jgi:hypothetical protein
MDYPDPLPSTRSELDFIPNATVLHWSEPPLRQAPILNHDVKTREAAMAAFAKSWRAS